jgi:hypothetical protein
VQLHLAKKALHSAKPLLSAALGKELSAYPFTAKASLPSAECRALGKEKPRDGRVTVPAPLPSVKSQHSAKKNDFSFLKNIICQVPLASTRQS